MPDRDVAAILLMLLPEDDAAALVAQLDPQAIEAIGAAMFAIGTVDEQRVRDALDRFVAGARSLVDVGQDVAGRVDAVVRRALPPARADQMLGRIVPDVATDPLPSLKWLSAADLGAIARDEHPQLVAMILTHLPADRAATLLGSLPDAQQGDLLHRAATLGPVSRAAYDEADAILAAALGTGLAAGDEAPVRAPAIAAILNAAPKAMGARLIKTLAKRDRTLAAAVEADMLRFDDLLALSAKDLGALTRAADPADWALALRTVADADRDAVFATMSQRAADTMRDAIAEATRVPLDDVLAAQRRVIAAAKTLADEGAIVLGGADAAYV